MGRVTAGVWALLSVWAAAWAWSFLGAQMTEPTGDGFTRGLNRVGVFLAWQGVAFVLALVLAVQRRRLPRGWTRRLALVPVGLSGALVLFVAGLLAWAQVQHLLHAPDPAAAPPATQPATDAAPLR